MKISTAIIGGTGIYSVGEKIQAERTIIETDYGQVELTIVSNGSSQKVAFLCRHGNEHQIPPHNINYRANIQALKRIGVERIIATNAVGGIYPHGEPGSFVVPDQLIDYTFGREHTYFDDFSSSIQHIDFTYPYSPFLRRIILESISALGYVSQEQGVYACVQGPRLETAAEVQRYARDGCTVIGMTGMPEAALARELEIEYASLCFSVNWAAGTSSDIISMNEIHKCIESCREKLNAVLMKVFQMLENTC